MSDKSMTYHNHGDPCPKCGEPLVKRGGGFALREVGVMPGLFCDGCNSLWSSQEFVEALRARAEAYRRARGLEVPTREPRATGGEGGAT
jgi:hypothetical protein